MKAISYSRPPFAQVVLDGRESLRTNSCTSFAESGGNAIARPAYSCRIRFRGSKANDITWTEVAEARERVIR